MKTPSFTSLAVVASALVSTVSAADLDPIVIKGSSKSSISLDLFRREYWLIEVSLFLGRILFQK
jgi:hypothetical protein